MRIVILTYPSLTALDAIGPFEVFNCLRDFDIRFAWKEAGPVVADGGRLMLGAIHALNEIDRCDLLLVPGSTRETPTLMADGEVVAWIKQMHALSLWTASVCSGALLLAAAGLLEGQPAASHWAALPILPRYGAIPAADKHIVETGRVITAPGVSAGIDLALHLVAKLRGSDQVKMAQLLIEYVPQPPFDAGHMRKLALTNPRNPVTLPNLVLQRWHKGSRRARG